jgi:hypothetical protein
VASLPGFSALPVVPKYPSTRLSTCPVISQELFSRELSGASSSQGAKTVRRSHANQLAQLLALGFVADNELDNDFIC